MPEVVPRADGHDVSRPFPVVVLCTSAGGLDALYAVLEPLPADFGACVLVLQHQRPQRTGLLAPLLRRRCALPVRFADDGEALVPGEVLVVPPGTHMLVTSEARVRLVPSGAIPPARPSADLLLCTAAASLGDRVIGVVLTGGGQDGAVGAAALHACGGRVVVQDPRTAFASGMPLAAIERDAPVLAELPDIAGVLLGLVTAARDGSAAAGKQTAQP